MEIFEKFRHSKAAEGVTATAASRLSDRRGCRRAAALRDPVGQDGHDQQSGLRHRGRRLGRRCPERRRASYLRGASRPAPVRAAALHPRSSVTPSGSREELEH